MSQYLITTVLFKCSHTVSCVIPFTKITMFPYSEQVLNSKVQVLEMIWMQNELFQANEMIFMNFWYIEHYGARF